MPAGGISLDLIGFMVVFIEHQNFHYGSKDVSLIRNIGCYYGFL